jgi:hypothetical protein
MPAMKRFKILELMKTDLGANTQRRKRLFIY